MGPKWMRATALEHFLKPTTFGNWAANSFKQTQLQEKTFKFIIGERGYFLTFCNTIVFPMRTFNEAAIDMIEHAS